MSARYQRQIAVPGFGAAGQDALARARIVVIGTGGLAAPVLQYLVGAGVGHLRVVDPDVVDLSNLHRQTLFRMDDRGRPKAQCAAAAMAALNPDCRLEPIVAALDPAKVAHMLEGADLVLDCADSFAASYVLSDHCLAAALPLISASVLQRDGYCGGFCAGAPSLRALFPDLPDRLGSCAADGVLGPVVGMVGSIQAQMALDVLSGRRGAVLGRLVTFDADAWRFGGFRFDGAPEPAAEDSFAFIAGSQIAPEDRVVDLRAPGEAPLATEGALRSSVERVEADLAGTEDARRLVLCCASGQRSWAAASRLAGKVSAPIVLAALGRGDAAASA